MGGTKILTPIAMDAIHDLARQPFTKEEEEAYAEALLIGHRQCHPYYKHIIRRLAPQRARRRLQSLQDSGVRLLTYVQEAHVALKDYKVIQFTDLIRALRPRVIYEFGAGGSTCLFAELLQENHRKYGIRGALHSFEQSEDYYRRMSAAFPEDLRSYVTWHFCETRYAWRGPHRALGYKKPHLNHPVVDLVYVDGPDHIYGTEHFREYPFFNSDLIDLVGGGVQVRCAVNDVRWFNKSFFEHFLSATHRCDLCLTHKSFMICPR
ncbi:hypothetical protein A3H22_02775 [Candidatus Peribacteria bacterium RIFCSPLOWO2_12_FULL_55_15]|nr:MAG: hypothetical protein A2789_04160 [Candidatus Peribacteria bacterium RIFCSPHIGHO2_01_FULL_54_22]OGJ63270.1 MAG: hypothetical protein A3D12_02985 [Candidatus Peribacteria bacterium RIFCSPHIGHO2_02_FULL_55_24]OGJ68556.1 MAG: hypothetical protein A2947_00575 [Candidatus Peribacteria bacterium RIFCSPLOWO2_01_FULL_54_110]OGJ70430.1 MAG: hypothetical protein A3H90_01795 [Candidatus Peribacteria bacterium RIFCSPLOWO2_02_FULL_55_36]OGJ70581.1 MAG: hypothetical protein A3H22_02775 [Candidatus Per